MKGEAASASEPCHWYVFTFMHTEGNLTHTKNNYFGYTEQIVTMPRIAEAKKAAGVPETAVLLDVSYLGFCSRNTFDQFLE